MTRVQGLGMAAFAAITCASESCFAAGDPPYFTSYSPLFQVLNLDQGQRSLELTGTAVDNDAGDILRFIPSGMPSFMAFQSINGNPGQFRITADNLNASHIGGYAFDVVVLDSATSPEVSSLSYFVTIIPEPSGLGLLAFVALPRRRH